MYIVHKCMVCTTKMTVRSHSKLFSPLTEALQTSPTIPKPMKSVVHKQNLEFLHHKSHYNFAYFQFMKNFLIMNSSHIRTVLERNPQQAVRLYSCDYTYVHIQPCTCMYANMIWLCYALLYKRVNDTFCICSRFCELCIEHTLHNVHCTLYTHIQCMYM